MRLPKTRLRRFAAAYDPQWFHADPKAAAHGRYGGLIASGWHTCSIAMRLAVDNVLERIRVLRLPRRRLHQMAESRAAERQPDPQGGGAGDRGNPAASRDLGILRWRWRVFNQHGLEVLESEATSLFDLSPRSGA